MGSNILDRNWNEARDKIKNLWTKISEEDLVEIKGDFGRLVNKLQTKYGITIEEAKDKVDRFLDNLNDKIDTTKTDNTNSRNGGISGDVDNGKMRMESEGGGSGNKNTSNTGNKNTSNTGNKSNNNNTGNTDNKNTNTSGGGSKSTSASAGSKINTQDRSELR